MRGIADPPHAQGTGWGVGSHVSGGGPRRTLWPRRVLCGRARRRRPCPRPWDGGVGCSAAVEALGAPLGNIGLGAAARGIAGPPHTRGTGWEAAGRWRRPLGVPVATSALGEPCGASPGFPTPLGRAGGAAWRRRRPLAHPLAVLAAGWPREAAAGLPTAVGRGGDLSTAPLGAGPDFALLPIKIQPSLHLPLRGRGESSLGRWEGDETGGPTMVPPKRCPLE